MTCLPWQDPTWHPTCEPHPLIRTAPGAPFYPLGLNQLASVCSGRGMVSQVCRAWVGPPQDVGVKQNCPSLALCIAGGLWGSPHLCECPVMGPAS